MTKTELTKTLKAIIDRESAFIERNMGNDNPQVVEMVTRAQERKDLAQAVVWATQGDASILKTYL